MADNATAPVKKKIEQPTNPIKLDISRNNVSVQFTEQLTTRGQEPGKQVFDPSTADKQKFLDWVGLDNVVGIVRAKVRALTMGWVEASIDEDTKEFLSNVFVTHATQFDASGETIGDLEDQREEAQAELVKLDLSNPDNMSAFVELGKSIQKLTVAIDSKKRPRKAKEAVPA